MKKHRTLGASVRQQRIMDTVVQGNRRLWVPDEVEERIMGKFKAFKAKNPDFMY